MSERFEVNIIEELMGKVFISVQNNRNEELLFLTDNDDAEYKFYHEQDCCEHVQIVDIAGDLSDLINSPILQAEETIKDSVLADVEDEYGDTNTWTFYKFATIKGSVTVRWLGSSNGYYSESVDFCKIGKYD